MADLLLYHFPGACSNVCLHALETAGLDYDVRLVDLARGEQMGEAYTEIVPLGKVPAMQTRDGLVTENAAILTYIHSLAPEAGLFPATDAPIALARRAAGLSFCGGNLHPIVRGLMNPARMTDGYAEGVRSKSKQLAKKSFAYAEQILQENGWWLGEWSLVDVYLDWALSVARKAGFDLSSFPALHTLRDRLAEHPVSERVATINAGAEQELAARVA